MQSHLLCPKENHVLAGLQQLGKYCFPTGFSRTFGHVPVTQGMCLCVFYAKNEDWGQTAIFPQPHQLTATFTASWQIHMVDSSDSWADGQILLHPGSRCGMLIIQRKEGDVEGEPGWANRPYLSGKCKEQYKCLMIYFLNNERCYFHGQGCALYNTAAPLNFSHYLQQHAWGEANQNQCLEPNKFQDKLKPRAALNMPRISNEP